MSKINYNRYLCIILRSIYNFAQHLHLNEVKYGIYCPSFFSSIRIHVHLVSIFCSTTEITIKQRNTRNTSNVYDNICLSYGKL